MFQNKYSGKCHNPACNLHVGEGQGFTEKLNGRYVVWCKNCVPQQIQATPRRILTADFKIICPYEPQNLPLIRSLPGAWWDATNKWWEVSPAIANRRRLLEVADRLKLEVPPFLREIPVTDEAQNAMSAGLYPFQVEGVNFLAHKNKAILGDDMGLGKTVQSLMSIPRENGQALVICRAGLKFNWLDEAKKWRKDLKTTVLSGRNSFRWPEPGELLIINREILPTSFETIPKGKGEHNEVYWARLKGWRESLKIANPQAEKTTVIVDEAHDYKHYDSQRSKKVKEFCQLAGKVIGLTGSPLDNRPDDLYGVFDVLGLAYQTFGSINRFKTLFNAKSEAIHTRRSGSIYKTIWGKPDPVVPELLRRVMLRRKRVDVLPDLPNKTYTNIVVGDVDPVLKDQLDKMWEDWGTFIEVEGKLPPFEKFSEIREKLARSRIPAMLEYIEDAEEQECPLVVFSAHLAPMDVLLTRPGWAVITGATSPERRQQIVRDFQDGKLKGVGCTHRAGGVGINLTKAWKALMVDLDWTPGSNSQSEDRICRIGQLANKVEIIRMVSDHPLDIHVLNLLVDKMDTIQKALDEMVETQTPINTPQGETEEEFQSRMAKVIAQMDAFEQNKNELLAEEKKKIAKSKVATINSRERTRFGKVILPLTPERVEAVKNSFAYMLSICDGARDLDNMGFNKPDAAVAHWVLSTGLETSEEVETAFLMLQRYHRQLGKSYPVLFS